MSKTLILLAGYKRSGKDTTGSLLKDKLKGKQVELVSYAYKLKKMCHDAFNPLLELISKTYGIQFPGDFFEEKSPIHRLILQKVGTEIVREVNPKYWVETLSDYIYKSDSEVFIATDFRFPNEYHDIVKNMDLDRIITCRVVRPLALKDEDSHKSEHALDDFKFDFEILNDGDMTQLSEKIDGFIEKYELVQ